MASVRCIYLNFSIFASLSTLPVHAYACVLEKLKCLKPLQPDSWGHRSRKSREKCQCCWAGCRRAALAWLLVARFSCWWVGWNRRLLLEHEKWRWCEAQKSFSCFWASLHKWAWGEQAPRASSRPLWLCVSCQEVPGTKGKARISGFNHFAAVIPGKSASRLLASPLCKAGAARPSLWVLGDGLDGAASQHRVLLGGLSWEMPTLVADKQSLSQTHLRKSVFWHLLPTVGSYWGVIPLVLNEGHVGLWNSLGWARVFICGDNGAGVCRGARALTCQPPVSPPTKQHILSASPVIDALGRELPSCPLRKQEGWGDSARLSFTVPASEL